MTAKGAFGLMAGNTCSAIATKQPNEEAKVMMRSISRPRVFHLPLTSLG